jgi:hypothetical protein
MTETEITQVAILFGVPAAAIALSGLGLHFVHTPWVRRISSAALSTQVLLAGLAWLLLDTLPRETNWSGAVGATCPRMDGVQGGVILAIALVSLGVAAVALSSGFTVTWRRAGSGLRILGGFGAAAITVAIFIGILGTALCGMN